MQIGVLEFLKLETSRANAATILVRTMRTIEVLRVRQGQLQFADTGDTGKELRMRDSSLTHSLTQVLLGLLLSYDLAEEHYLPNSFFKASTISAYSASER